jgi:hypothetical protein
VAQTRSAELAVAIGTSRQNPSPGAFGSTRGIEQTLFYFAGFFLEGDLAWNQTKTIEPRGSEQLAT